MNSKTIPLKAGYTAEFDAFDGFEWYKIIGTFSDANIYQTWAYDAIRFGEENISHFVLREGKKIVAAAQARIVRLPFLGLGVAYIRWGPMWNQQNEAIDLSAFQCAVRALRNEYVCRRGLILRILPLLHDYNSNLYIDILQKEGYSHALKRDRERTLILDIRAPTEELRKKLDQKWRNCLNKAERNQLELVEGTDDELFAEFISIYQDLLRRKNFPEPNNIREFRIIQQALPSELKMRIFLCRSNGFSSAGVICSAIGQTGIYLFGATNDQGMTNKASYLLQWRAIQWMREEGCQYYNLNGINPLINPGTYHFKAGLSGKNGKDVRYIGHFDSYSGWINAALIRAAEPLYPIVKKVLVRRLQLGESKRM